MKKSSGREERTVPYFPFYAKDGDTLFLLEEKYHCKGTGFFTNVLRFLSLTPDHWYRLDSKIKKLRFYKSCKCDPKSGEDMLNMMAETGKIDAKLWHGFDVIVSADFLESVARVYERRKAELLTVDNLREAFHVAAKNNESYPQAGDDEKAKNGQTGAETDFMSTETDLATQKPSLCQQVTTKDRIGKYSKKKDSKGSGLFSANIKTQKTDLEAEPDLFPLPPEEIESAILEAVREYAPTYAKRFKLPLKTIPAIVALEIPKADLLAYIPVIAADYAEKKKVNFLSDDLPAALARKVKAKEKAAKPKIPPPAACTCGGKLRTQNTNGNGVDYVQCVECKRTLELENKEWIETDPGRTE